jgi:hypothetical protein
MGSRGGSVKRKPVIAASVIAASASVVLLLPQSEASIEPVFFPAVITVMAYDENGATVEQDFDADPIARFDIWSTGPGDVNFDGRVDLADLNTVLSSMGAEYR